MIQSNPSTTEADARALEIFNLQTRACLKQPVIALKTRLALLNTIEDILKENDQAICEAIHADFGSRSFHETRILEITPCLMGLRYTRKKLKKWIKPQRRHVSHDFSGCQEPGHSPGQGGRGHHHPLELSAVSGNQSHDLRAGCRQPDHGQTGGPVSAPVPPAPGPFFSRNRSRVCRFSAWGVCRHFFRASFQPPGVHRISPDRENRDADCGPESGAGHPGAGGQITGDPGR